MTRPVCDKTTPPSPIRCGLVTGVRQIVDYDTSLDGALKKVSERWVMVCPRHGVVRASDPVKFEKGGESGDSTDQGRRRAR